MAASTMDETKLPGGYLVTPRVPQGLAAAVEGLTREVIRHSPEDIYVFAAHHFEKLLVLREKCGGKEKVSDRDSNLRALREMSQALKMREVERGNVRLTGNSVDQVGWSLNQTAKVLKRHRSIFGEAGRRISTDEVFRMANQKENRELPVQSSERTGSRIGASAKKKSSDKNAEELWKASTSRTERSSSNEDNADKNEMNCPTRSGPRIITQMSSLQNSGTGMLARDIKTELRKNRISSRDRRSVRAKPEEAARSAIDRSVGKTGKSDGKSGKNVSSRKTLDRQKRMEPEIDKKPRDVSVDSTRSLKVRRSEEENSYRKSIGKLESRALSMDRVKDTVVQKFATAKSLEELQSVNYVEKVQEIINETGPIIKGKIDELKSGMIGRSKRSSWFTESRKDRARESIGAESDNRCSGEYVCRKDSSGDRESRRQNSDALRSRLTETQCLMENVSSSLTRPMRRSRSARSSGRSRSEATTREGLSDFRYAREDSTAAICLESSLSNTRNLLADISTAVARPMRRSVSAKTLHRHDEFATDDSSDFGSRSDALKTRLDETRHLLESLSASFTTPARRRRSAKGSRNNVNSAESSHSDQQSVSKVSLPAVRSVSVRSSSGSVSRSDSGNLVLPAISPEAPKSAKVKEDLVLPVLSPPGTGSSNDDSKIVETDDGLLVELDIPEIPVEDCIPEVPVEDVFRDSLNVTPNFDSVPQRPDSLEPEETPEVVEEKTIKVDDLEARLREIRNVEKDIEEIFVSNSSNDPKTAEAVGESNMRKKLQELEEAERRIDKIFDREVCKGKESKDSPGSEGDVDAPVEIIDESDDRAETVGEETRIVRALPNPTELSDVDGSGELDAEERKIERLTAVSPECLDYTYVLTEGSLYDIPDSVTTVIIPDRTIETPESGIEDIQSNNDPARKSASLSESATEKRSIEEVVVVDDPVKGSKTSDAEEPAVEGRIAEEATKITDESSKKIDRSIEEDSSAKIESDLFGEFVKPEITIPTSTDTEFIRGIENTRHDMKISHQDLGRINEEMSEELEGLDEHDNHPTKGSTNFGQINENKNEEETLMEDRQDNHVKEAVDESRDKTESDLSPIASRPEVDSVSSNEAKESSAVDEALESAKCPMSLDEEASSATRSPESSNEVKETTLTDALSLSLDPMRPYVPELNLDSLQDLTVSSFKMTEDEYETHDRAENENTNSITDTLTSDDNNRIIDSAEFAEEAVMEYLPTSSDRSKLEETNEDSNDRWREVVEEPIAKSHVEVKEDICEKIAAYVTGPSNGEEIIATDEAKTSEVEQDTRAELQGELKVTDDEANLPKAERDVELEERREKEVADDGTIVSEAPESSRPEDDGRVVATDGTEISEAEQFTQGDQGENKVDPDARISPAPENSETLGTKSIEADNANGSVESQSLIETKALEISTIEEVADRNISEDERKEEAETESSAEPENINVDIEAAKGDDSEALPDEELQGDVRSENPEMRNKEEEMKDKRIKEGNNGEEIEDEETKDEDAKSGSSNLTDGISEGNAEVESTDEVNKSGDLNGASRSGDDGPDETPEENFMEEETPLAVSRSASQCTTRRVSSGNLARLREDPSLSWAEEVGPEATDEEDQISAKVKFSKIGGETIKEQGSDEINQSPGSGEVNGSDSAKGNGDEINDSQTKDSKEYHIYVPDVDADVDNSTTDSSTVESAVTKIQARVRGFLTRRRVHRGQHNRSSTLGSIPSIQDSIAVDPKMEEGREEMGMSSLTAPEEGGLESAATKIQSNYRRYKARNRLRREDAVQRTTLSMEKSFAESGLQHTGEFHDCIPLPIHDLPLKKISLILTEEATSDLTSDSITTPSLNDKTTDSDSKSDEPKSDKIEDDIASPKSSQRFDNDPEGSTVNRHDNVEDPLLTQDLGQMMFGQASNVPIIKFGVSQNIGQIVDLVVLAKEEAALQSGYLNFITSVEDADGVDVSSEASTRPMGSIDGDDNSNESFKEPLALSITPIGVVIEEVTTSGAENFMRPDDLEPTIASTVSSAAPEVATESLDSARAPCASSEALSVSLDGHEAEDNALDEPEVQQVGTENSKAVDCDVHSGSAEDEGDLVKSDETEAHFASEEKIEDNLVLPTESTMEDLIVSENLSLEQEKGLLGPESSVDSMECPVTLNETKVTSGSSGELVEKSAVTQTVFSGGCVDEASSSGLKEENPKDDEPSCSNADDSSSILSFSMKVQDFLGLGSEDSAEFHGRKPILEVTLSPGDLMKSMSTSQDSQFAGERIESPITMVQMAPGSSESVQQDDLSDNDGEDETNRKLTLGSSFEKSEKT